ncbi:hypothetical protein [Paenibacillus sp. GYB003]|uniref:hypothetical protein n=1 Tax=Paenibacillus sp. GYB003 TaxID=2994392 RepID=UPI002F963609
MQHWNTPLRFISWTWMALVAKKRQAPVTSDPIAAGVNTNPVFIRRILGQLGNCYGNAENTMEAHLSQATIADLSTVTMTHMNEKSRSCAAY